MRNEDRQHAEKLASWKEFSLIMDWIESLFLSVSANSKHSKRANIVRLNERDLIYLLFEFISKTQLWGSMDRNL